MKGIILAGGSGTRLYPSTLVTSKQLLPVFDKPMIYYPLSVLMLADIKDILIITTEDDSKSFKKLLGDGSNYGINLNYATQKAPNGLAEAFIIGKEFVGKDIVTLILGDNIFFGPRFSATLQNLRKSVENNGGAYIFAYPVRQPERFGIVEFDHNDKILSLEEKPQNPKSNYAITGLYIYDNKVLEYAQNLKPSPRGELEITDINKMYFANNNLKMEKLGRGFSWLDTGTHHSLLQAGQYIQTIEENQGIKIACLEEIAYRMKFLSKEEILSQITNVNNNEYYNYVKNLVA
jgi:glucose-1-phosphate thymidylyltransferase